MTEEELVKIMTVFDNAYPNRFGYLQKDKDDRKFMRKTWMMFLREVPYEVGSTAAKKLIVENKYPPSINDFMEKIDEVKNPDKLNGDEAYALVMKAVRKYGRYNVKEAMESLPPICKRAVDLFGGFESMCNISGDPNEELFAKKQFKRIYDTQQERQDNYEKLPASAKEELDKRRSDLVDKVTGSSKMLNSGDGKNGSEGNPD